MEAADIGSRLFEDRDEFGFDGGYCLVDLLRSDLHRGKLGYIKAGGVFVKGFVAVFADVRDDIGDDILNRGGRLEPREDLCVIDFIIF